MENSEVREQLASIVRRYGQAVFDDQLKLQGLLKDVVGSHRKEINILMAAVRADVPGELLRSSGPAGITAERLAAKLQEETGLTSDWAQWAVTTWANALGIPVGFDAAEPDAKSLEPLSPNESPEEPRITKPVPPPVVTMVPAIDPAPTPVLRGGQSWPPVPPPPIRKQGIGTGLTIAIALVVVGAIGAIIYVATHRKNSDDISNGGFSTYNYHSPTPDLTPSESPSDSADPSPSNSETSSPTTTPWSPSAEIGKVVDGVYTDGPGLFSFTPPAGWTMTSNPTKGNVEWDSTNADVQAWMDVRAYDPGGDSPKSLADQKIAQLKKDLNFKTEASKEFKLGDETGQIIGGTYSDKTGDHELAVVIAVHSPRAYQITMSGAPSKFKQLADETLNASVQSWKWLGSGH